MKIGVIGTGNIASTGHMPAINSLPQALLVAVLSREKEVGESFLKTHHAPDAVVYSTLDSFMADTDVELVIICSPDKVHYEQAKGCLKAGKHVLLEKPLTLEEAEANELIELANKNNLILATGFHLRSHVGHRLLHEAVVNGKIGELRHIRVIWAFPQKDDSNWRAKDDLARWWSLSAVGSHCLDLARWFAQDQSEWEQFSSTIAKNIWKGSHDETAVISGQFSSGPTVEVVSSVQFGPYNRVELFGDRGQAVCEGTLGREGAGNIIINNSELSFQTVSPFVEQLKDLIDCIENHKKPRADGSVGLRSVKDLLQAIV